MPQLEWHRYASDKALAEAAAKRWVEEAAHGTNQAATQACALSGGRIARAFLAAAALEAGRLPMAFRTMHFFWADERCVPPGDAESNFRIAREALFEPWGISPAQIHRVRGELPPEEACALAEQELRGLLTSRPEAIPALDWIFLGMGEDGHVASLFPGAPSTVEDPGRVYAAVQGPKPPPNRITMTYAALVAARKVVVLVSGAGKREVLERSLDPTGTTPLARVIRTRTEITIFSSV